MIVEFIKITGVMVNPNYQLDKIESHLEDELWMCWWRILMIRLIEVGRSVYYGRHYSLGQDPGVYEKEKMRRADISIVLSFLIVDVMQPMLQAPAAVISLPWCCYLQMGTKTNYLSLKLLSS